MKILSIVSLFLALILKTLCYASTTEERTDSHNRPTIFNTDAIAQNNSALTGSNGLIPFERELAIEQIESHGYKVIRPLRFCETFSDGPPPAILFKAAILDTETTGLNLVTDKIIELAFVIVEYCPETGQLYRVSSLYDELEDPGMPIPPEATKINGITNDMVSGKRIIDSDVEKLMSDVSLIIAHNAAFDRVFGESRFSFLQNKAWACSLTQIPWKSEGFSSLNLEFLAYKFGFHFSAHRASVDCQALLEILQSNAPSSGVRIFKTLLDNARLIGLKLWALKTPYQAKNKLKGRAYKWNAERKVWYTTISSDGFEQEVNWLRTEIYANRAFSLEHEKIDAYNRFTDRHGTREVVNYAITKITSTEIRRTSSNSSKNGI